MLQSYYGMNFNIVLLAIFIFLKSLHRVPSSGSLISVIKKKNLPLINHLLLIFKHFLFTSRENGTICFTNMKNSFPGIM